MLVPTSKETAYVVIVELNLVKDTEPAANWARIHPVLVDSYIKDPVKGEISVMSPKLGFIPLQIKMN